MIKPDARLSIRILGLNEILITEYQERYPTRLAHYMQLLKAHPGEYAGLLSVQPSKTHEGLYELLDGHTRYVASIMMGKPDALCLIVEEPA
jgi:hypothetical protein